MFNPYSQWLGLPADLAKPNYFHLLRIKADVTDPEAIAKAAQKATLKVRSAKPGDRMLEWTQLIAEIETARMVLSDPATRKAYIKQVLAEKKARDEEKANAVAASAFVEEVEEEPEASELEEESSEDASFEEEEDDPMAAWSAAYGGAKPARSSGSPAVGLKGAGSKKVGAKAIGPKGIGPKGAVAEDTDEGPIQIRKAVKGRKKAGPLVFAAMGLLFLLAIGGAAFGGVYAFKMLDGEKPPGPGPEVASNTNANPNPAPAPAPVPAVTPDPAVAPTPTGVNDGGFSANVTPVPEQENPVEPPATGSSDPFGAAMQDDPELAASAAPDDPFYVEPTLRKFGYELNAQGATSVAMTETMPEGPTPEPAPTGRELTEDERTEVDAALTEIRGLLMNREVPAAEQRIGALAQKFQETQASQKIEAVAVLTQKFREFWIAVVRGAMKTPTGTPLDYEGTPFSLVEASAQLVVVRVGGENKRWAPVALPGGLAKYFAENDLDGESWNTDVVMGTIYALENDGAKADKAREHWEKAADGDPELAETVQKLLPLLSVEGWKAP